MKRLSHNPILVPEHDWEKRGAFNPSVIKTSTKYHLLYRAVDQEGISRIAAADSKDGLSWNHKHILIEPDQDFDQYGCEDPRVTFIDDQYVILYTAISIWPPEAKGIKLAIATSKDLKTISSKKPLTPFNAKAAAILPKKINNQYVIALTVNTDHPPAKIALAFADQISDFNSPDYWHKWYSNLDQHQLNLNRLNSDQVELGATPLETSQGWLWFYSHIQNYYQPDKRIFGIEAVITKAEDPTSIISRTTKPLLTPQAEYEISGEVKNVIFPSGAITLNQGWRVYYGAADTFSAAAEITKSSLQHSLEQTNLKEVLKLNKSPHNPILTPDPNRPWEAKAVFNPAVVYEQGVFHLIYRALSPDMVSTLGYAMSHDGVHFETRSTEPIYVPRMSYEQKQVDGNYSGCEDPRIVKVGNRFYMFYTAYDGQGPPRVAMSWIKVDDFVKHNWLWSPPTLISPPGIDNKNTCIFPEKINGKYLMLHRVGGRDIAIDWLMDLNHFDGLNWLEKEESINRIEHSWQGEKIGIGAPPIKTDSGWLLIYHGVSDIDSQYRAGAMLLDLDDPTKVLARTQYPLLEPTESYEQKGLVNNVVFPCGAAVAQGQLFVYYGAADQSIGVATIELNKLLSYLKDSQQTE